MPIDQPPAIIQELPPGAAQWRPLGRPTDSVIQIQNCDHDECNMVVTIYMTGRVEFGKGFTATDADKAFWKQIGDSLPVKCEKP